LSTRSSESAIPYERGIRPTESRGVDVIGGHSPEQSRPLGGYAVLLGGFLAAAAGFGGWLRRSGTELPEHVDVGDLALATIASHKLSRLLARDRVTSTVRAPFTRFQRDAGPGEVDEAARGHGVRRAIGELLVCPYCLGMWTSAAFTAGMIARPRPTRWIAATFTALTGADLLQIGYAKAENALG
jgi:hypothetical protein